MQICVFLVTVFVMVAEGLFILRRQNLVLFCLAYPLQQNFGGFLLGGDKLSKKKSFIGLI